MSRTDATSSLAGERHPVDRGIFVGEGQCGWVWAGPERPTLALGPTRSGKTSSLIVPNVLSARGAVVSTSTKPDVLELTAPARRRAGWCFLFDPGGEMHAPPGVDRVAWSPVTAAASWDGALSVADSMVRAARPGRGPRGELDGHDHWTERAGALLAPLLQAAALSGAPMRSVLRWVDRHDGATALDLLVEHAGEDAVSTDLLAGILATDAREQSGIWSTASGVLAAYRSDRALASTEGAFLDLDRFCDGPHTLYICSSGRQQALHAPLVVGMLAQVRDAAYRRAREGVTRPPVLLALDEVANIAPLPDLPAVVTEGAGQGLLTLACLQDLSQARARWGAEGEALLSLFGTSVVLGGIGDVPTLEALSTLAGEHELVSRSVGWTQGGGRRQTNVTDGSTLRPRLPPDVVARAGTGWALVVDSTKRMGWIRLTPAHATSPWSDLIALGRERGRGHPPRRAPGEDRRHAPERAADEPTRRSGLELDR